MNKQSVQFSQLVNMSNPDAVLEEVKRNFLSFYPISEFALVRRVFTDFQALYRGDYPGYCACNTRYHDTIHVTDTLLAMSRLIDGYNVRHGAIPVKHVKLGLIAALLHDAGYIQTTHDHKGTGAKYTLHHVERSVKFAEKYFKKNKLADSDYPAVKNMITCTDLFTKISSLKFARYDKTLSCMLGASDILGQMASRCYLERLFFLYREFREGHVAGYTSEINLLRKTLAFSEAMEKRLKHDLMDTGKYAKDHFKKRYGINENLYSLAIHNHVNHLRTKVLKDPKHYRDYLRRRGP